MWKLIFAILALHYSKFAHSDSSEFWPLANCTLLYSLNSQQSALLEQHAARLNAQFVRHGYQLVNLNGWSPPFDFSVTLNGQQKQRFRTLYNVPNNQNQIIIFNRENAPTSRHSSLTSLVELLLTCNQSRSLN